MTFNPQIPIVWLMLIVISVIILTTVSIWFSSKLQKKWLKFLILFLRMLSIFGIALIVLNPVKLIQQEVSEETRKDILLIDASGSMNIETPVSRFDQLRSVLEDLNSAELEKLMIYSFDTVATKLDSLHPITSLEAGGSFTNMASSIQQIINQEGAQGIGNLIVCSDGQMNDLKKLEQTISIARTNEIAVSVLGIGQPTKLFNASIKSCYADRYSPPNAKLPVKVYLESVGSNQEAFQLNLLNSKDELIDSQRGILREGISEISLNVVTGIEKENYKLELSLIEGELTAADNSFQFEVIVSDPKIRVLYMEGTNANYRRSTDYSKGTWPAYRFIHDACEKTGRIEVDSYVVDHQRTVGGEIYQVKTRRRGYPKTKAAIFKYDVVICSDINRFIFNDNQLEWTRELVAENGGGFCMIGGNTSFGSGGYDKTIWEQMIPVDMRSSRNGQIGRIVRPVFPEKNLKHPILKIHNNLDKNRSILKNHPPFRGTNIVNRAKPAATVLAYWKDRMNMPLICVQPYGKGRSMAFTSDAAGGWGEGYQDGWGVPRGNNNYFQQFWVNAVMWLAENSKANKQEKLMCFTDKLSYHVGETIKLEAEVSGIEDDYRLESYLLSSSSEKVKLKYNKAKQAFFGDLSLSEKWTYNEVNVVCEAIRKSGSIYASDTITVPIKQINPEYQNPNPDFAALERLMTLTGGRNIQSADDIANLLADQSRLKLKDQVPQQIPIWDHWGFFLFLLSLFTTEWLIRKFIVTR